MAIAKDILPRRKPWLCSSILRLLSSQMALRCMSSWITNQRIKKNLYSWLCRCVLAVCSRSLIRRSLCHGCFSRSPTQSGPPRPIPTAPSAGCTAGRRAGPSSAEGSPAQLEGKTTTSHNLSLNWDFTHRIVKKVAGVHRPKHQDQNTMNYSASSSEPSFSESHYSPSSVLKAHSMG